MIKFREVSPFLLISLFAGVVFGVVWVWADNNQEGSSSHSTSTSMMGERARSASEDTWPLAPQAAEDSDRGDADGSAPERGSARETRNSDSGGEPSPDSMPVSQSAGAPSYFDPQVRGATGLLLTPPQPVTWASSCQQRPDLKTFQDLRDHVAAAHALPQGFLGGDVREWDSPAVASALENLEILHLNQFYRDQEAGEFLQLSIVQGGDPAMGAGYRIERYRFRDAEMNEIIGNEVLLPKSKRFDLDARQVRSEFASLMSEMKAPRYVAGARILIFSTEALPKTGVAATRAEVSPVKTTIELTDGVLTGYSTSDLSCEARFRPGGEAVPAVCECLTSDATR